MLMYLRRSINENRIKYDGLIHPGNLVGIEINIINMNEEERKIRTFASS